ncbi:hypothetical protein AB0C12_05045 [Actinoplanes sp. NPDC048967]|uniref:hypothetical protein n=1 Tax=Actinoplanes sp. NPDC048967 TaxID=3155269 RepID=UPI0033FC4AFE
MVKGDRLATTSTTASSDDVRVQSYAASTPDTQAPLVPGRPSVTVTPTTATLTWPPTVDNVGVTEYVVYQGEQFYQQYRCGRSPAPARSRSISTRPSPRSTSRSRPGTRPATCHHRRPG